MNKTDTCKKCKNQAIVRVLHAEGMAYVPACGDHKEQVKKSLGTDFSGFQNYDNNKKKSSMNILDMVRTAAMPPYVRSVPATSAPGVPGVPVDSEPQPDAPLLDYSPMGEEPPDQDLNPPQPLNKPRVQAYVRAPAYVRTAAPLPKPKKPVSQMSPEELAQYRAASEQSKKDSLGWLQANPRHPDNIVNHWNQSTDDHIKQGMNWYPDAHHAAKTIANDTGISVNQAAGLIANYSPQQHWAQNLRMASMAARGIPIGGKKQPGQEGFMASASQAQAASRIMAGEDYHDIFKGQKITAFGHLIEHGGDTDENDPQVVVDRHALGVAHGGYADDGIYNHSGISSRKPVYNESSQMYKDAASQISAQTGSPVAPHQVQAATWLTRQRLNMEGGYSSDDPSAGQRVKAAAESSTKKWNDYAAIHHPDLVNKVPGTGFSASTGQGGMPQAPEAQPAAQPAAPPKVAMYVRSV